MALLLVLLFVVCMAALRARLLVWTLGLWVLCGALAWRAGFGAGTSILLAVATLLVLALDLPLLRRALLTGPVYRLFRKLMPPLSRTEREALEAGTVWWDGELFTGRPDWKKLFALPPARLSAEEKAFLEGPVEELCALLNEDRIVGELRDLPPEAWAFMKERGFFGMIIPKAYGGLGFSALANSSVVLKLSSRSITAAVTVMVPNSLGPAELLLHYGTDAQKAHYLPRLASGVEVPCFALTSPEAASDAASIPDTGVLCRAEDGLAIRLNWDKRYITLAPVATVLGLAFRLRDPEHLLGDEEDLGITLALVPTDLPGIKIGTRHDPLGVPFLNGPTWGQDVVIPLDHVVGGRTGVGQGWRMLMECLAAGRSISLPALSTGCAKLTARVVGAYARIRRQFRMPIGRFEGVEEPLARIGGQAYLLEAARLVTCGAVDRGEKPSVLSAILKYNSTERMRAVVNDGMDVLGGAGISLGPRNILGRAFQAVPIGITVEGANILTRTMIIFGQGIIRCHPYLLKEMRASADPKGLAEFDRAFTGHVGFILANLVCTPLHALRPARGSHRYLNAADRLCTAFALTADASLFLLGGALKTKEKLAGRMADILSHLYLLSALQKHFADRGRPADELPFLIWASEDCLARIQVAFDGVFRNLPLGGVLRLLAFPFGRAFHGPSDRAGHKVAKALMEPGSLRDRLFDGLYLPASPLEALGRLEDALPKIVRAEAVEKKLRAAKLKPDAGVKAGAITEEEAAWLKQADAARRDVIRVDDFPAEHFCSGPRP